MPRLAIYPGTFDPLTNGHLDIIARAANLADELVVAVAANAGKKPLFNLDQRVALVRECCASFANVRVAGFDDLLVKFAAAQNADLLVRGLRAVSDFEIEFQMAAMNSHLNPTIETVFLMAADKYHFVSSRFVKEVARLGGDISALVPTPVTAALGHLLALEAANGQHEHKSTSVPRG